jgi:hypothetical protein
MWPRVAYLQIQQLEELLNSDAVVDKAFNLKADYLGPGNVAVSADIDFEGRMITRRYIDRETSLEHLAQWQPGMLLAEVPDWLLRRRAWQPVMRSCFRCLAVSLFRSHVCSVSAADGLVPAN